MRTQTKALWISAIIYYLVILAWYWHIDWLTTFGKFLYAAAELFFVGLFYTIFLIVSYFFKK